MLGSGVLVRETAGLLAAPDRPNAFGDNPGFASALGTGVGSPFGITVVSPRPPVLAAMWIAGSLFGTESPAGLAGSLFVPTALAGFAAVV
jgi:hypothetical protein